MHRELSRQEQLNDLLSAVMTASQTDTLPELQDWIEKEGFNCNSFNHYGSVARLVIDVAESLQGQTNRRFSHVRNLGKTLESQGY